MHDEHIKHVEVSTGCGILNAYMSVDVTGAWRLVAWRRIEDGSQVTYPLGKDATGILIYTGDLKMAVQMMASSRPAIDSDDALGGEADQRAAAYSTCLAYFGTYKVQGHEVIHELEASLYPNWTGTMQARPFSFDGAELILRTPPSPGPGGTVVNEISWVRA